MASQRPAECLDEIFEYLEDDKLILYLCLLVNRFWCKIAVRILWRNIWDFKNTYQQQRPLSVASSILSTLITCLPNESKELLYKNEIFISAPTSNPPLFNYPEFCKVLSINEITKIVYKVLKDRNYLVANEIIKMFTKVSTLKKNLLICMIIIILTFLSLIFLEQNIFQNYVAAQIFLQNFFINCLKFVMIYNQLLYHLILMFQMD
jgi:hypothetical protein